MKINSRFDHRVPLIALFVTLAIGHLSGAFGANPVGVVLTYEYAPCPYAKETAPGEARSINDIAGMKRLAGAINTRIGDDGKATALDDKRLQVELYGELDEAGFEAMKDRISGLGCLEFRILASETHEADKKIIEQARNTPPNEKDVVLDRDKVARWIPYSLGEFGPVEDRGSAEVKRLAGNDLEMLVLIDELHVTGDYLTSATTARDDRGRLAIQFSLNREGAEKLKQLTSRNKPDPAVPGSVRRMGIILDNRVLSAPNIIQAISDRGMISGGSMTEDEIVSIVETLNSGSLPRVIRLVDEKRVDDEK
jgi:preprotein translocase subunit SecD